MKRLRWCPSSREELDNAERKIFSYMKKKYQSRYVEVGWIGDSSSPCRLWTVTMDPSEPPQGAESPLPLVLLHGLGCGSALWVMNLEALSRRRVVHCIDLLGFGRSSRPALGDDAWLIEQQMVNSIEMWRQKMGLERFVLVGHSLGGFLSASYSLQYPSHVAHLVLEDPWGFPVFDPSRQRPSKKLPFWAPPIQHFLNHTNAFWGVRAIGHLGPIVLGKAISEADVYFGHFVKEKGAIPNYAYHCNVRRPTGEEAFRKLCVFFGWTKNPMMHRFLQLSPEVPVTFLYGDKSFITRSPAVFIKKQRESTAYVELKVLKDCGHNVHMEKPEEYNAIVVKVCDMADAERKKEIIAENHEVAQTEVTVMRQL
ncbi:(Lyso)-N-acylphosphatidylethanolamine lipase-like isoform X2 [Ornithodoros turicata]